MADRINSHDIETAVFAMNAETTFRIRARRNRLLAHWAAGKLGIVGAEVEAYARQLVQRGVELSDDVRLAEALRVELHAGGVELTPDEIHEAMGRMTERACREVLAASASSTAGEDRVAAGRRPWPSRLPGRQ